MTTQSKTILFIVFLTIISIRLFGHDIYRKEFSKEIHREFATTIDGQVSIFNKHGTVDIISWDKNLVRLDIKIIVNATSSARADEVLEQIDINFLTRKGFVSAETVIASPKTTFFSDWFATTDPSGYKIHYTVHMPKTNGLVLKTRYCDASMDYLSAKGDLHVKYGDLNSEGFGGDVKMFLSYGNGTFDKLKNLKGELTYGQLTLVSCSEVQLNTKYSKLNLVKATELDIYSKHDDYKIGDVNSLTIIGRYSDFDIEQADDIVFEGKYADLILGLLVNNGDFSCQYSDVVIEDVENGFGLLEIDGRYSDIKIGTKLAQSFCLEVEADSGDLSFPAEATVLEKGDCGKKIKVSAYFTSHYCSSKIRGIVSYGKLKIQN